MASRFCKVPRPVFFFPQQTLGINPHMEIKFVNQNNHELVQTKEGEYFCKFCAEVDFLTNWQMALREDSNHVGS